MYHTNRRHRCAARITVAGAVLLLDVTACGSGTGTPTVASAQTGQPSAAASVANDVIAQYVDAQRKWVACMRKQGYNLPDPDAKGQVDFGAFLENAKLPKTDPGLVAAETTCMPLQLPIPAELNPVPPLTAQQIDHLREYAKCMRANGEPDWPDPDPDGQWPNTGALGSNPRNPDGSALAIQICDPVAEGKPPASPASNRTAQG